MFGIGVSMKVSRSAPQPIRYYREPELETHVCATTARCAMRFTASLPGAGLRRAELAADPYRKPRARWERSHAGRVVDKELADHLVGDALENVVSLLMALGGKSARQGADISSEPGVRAPPRAGRVCRRLRRRAFPSDWIMLPGVSEAAPAAHRMGVVDASTFSARTTRAPSSAAGSRSAPRK